LSDISSISVLFFLVFFREELASPAICGTMEQPQRKLTAKGSDGATARQQEGQVLQKQGQILRAEKLCCAGCVGAALINRDHATAAAQQGEAAAVRGVREVLLDGGQARHDRPLAAGA
jgi:hypothetical protein